MSHIEGFAGYDLVPLSLSMQSEISVCCFVRLHWLLRDLWCSLDLGKPWQLWKRSILSARWKLCPQSLGLVPKQLIALAFYNVNIGSYIGFSSKYRSLGLLFFFLVMVEATLEF